MRALRAIVRHGPNAQGYLVLGIVGWVSYANWSLMPVLFLIGLCLPSLIFMFVDRRRGKL